jgi:hypothetical protein
MSDVNDASALVAEAPKGLELQLELKNIRAIMQI